MDPVRNSSPKRPGGRNSAGAISNGMDIRSTLSLNNGIEMPVLGLGVWQMGDGEETLRAVAWALEAGYRHIDTAKLYGNEKSVGEAVRSSKVPREEIFVTTKLWPTDFFNPRSAFEKSISRLGLDYVDLYLIHWPAPVMPQSIWRALEKIYDEKLARAIGVSNYGISNLEHLLSYARIAPTVNQVKFSPFDYKKDLLEYCKAKKYCPGGLQPAYARPTSK
jgi:diketogulonate reductase-like aldo/keto reductase